VRVSATGRTSEVALAVHNGGHPIPAAELEGLFAPLMRGTHYPADTEGRGLGLCIVHEIAKAHGGTVSLTSSAVAGTTARVRLPRAMQKR
jgi:phosphoserine phosphatase RsbU/P